MKYLKKHKRAFIISLVVFCLLLMWVTSVSSAGPTIFGRAFSTVTGGIQSGITSFAEMVGDRLEFFRGMARLQEENHWLRTQNEILTMENTRLGFVDQENANLTLLLDTARRFAEFPTQTAHVISVDPGNWYNRFRIDLGYQNGMVRNMAVLADGGLIGRVIQVSPRSSLVESIIHDTSGVSAMVYRTGHVGIVRGDIDLMMDGLVMMEFSNLDADIAVGDQIQTSQLSSIYPPGIAIGEVISVTWAPNGMPSAIIQPVASFYMIRHVLVITELFDLE